MQVKAIAKPINDGSQNQPRIPNLLLCARIILFKFIEDESVIIPRILNTKGISKANICAIFLKAPISEYLLLLAQPPRSMLSAGIEENIKNSMILVLVFIKTNSDFHMNL